MKLSIVILCWNDLKDISVCLKSIYEHTHLDDFEVIVSDNGSTNGTIEFIRENYPQVRLIENGANLRFAKGNNVAIHACQGEYILILNPDTIIHEGALDKVVAFADKHPEAGAFGCKVLNVDGSYQGCIRPLPTVRSEWMAALYFVKPLAYLSEWFHPGEYVRWKGNTERSVGWLAGCFIVARGELLKRLNGFDPQFFYYYEDTDLCRRIWEAGYPILYTPEASITHIGGQSTVKRFPRIAFALDGEVTRYLYRYKYEGIKGVRSSRQAALVGLAIRRFCYGLLQLMKPTEDRKKRLEVLRILFDWNWRLDPVQLIEHGIEPELEVKPAGRVMER